MAIFVVMQEKDICVWISLWEENGREEANYTLEKLRKIYKVFCLRGDNCCKGKSQVSSLLVNSGA